MKPFLFLAVCLMLALPAHAATDPFSEFRIPEHSWQSGSVAADLSAGRTHQTMPSASARASWFSSLLWGSLARGWDSDALQYGYGLSLQGYLETHHSNNVLGDPDFTYHSEEDHASRSAAENWQLDGSLRSYPLRMALGLGISAVAAGGYDQGWNRTNVLATWSPPLPGALRTEARNTVTRHLYRTQLRVQLSAGFGRVRDASVVNDVHQLEERLTETGALARPLSAQARAKLAALYYVAPFYATAHARPDRQVWRDLERILREDGALRGDALDAYSVLRAREGTAPAGRPTRQRGWFVGAVGGATTTHNIDRREEQLVNRQYVDDALNSASSSASSVRYASSYDQVLVGGQAEYHLPVGWRWQFDAATRLARPAREDETGLDLASSASARWYVSDRWAANVTLQQARFYFARGGSGGAPSRDQWTTQAWASIDYFIEDHTSLSLSFGEQQNSAPDDPYPSRRFARDSRVSFGITYRFLGRLDATGLIEPVRPLP